MTGIMKVGRWKQEVEFVVSDETTEVCYKVTSRQEWEGKVCEVTRYYETQEEAMIVVKGMTGQWLGAEEEGGSKS